MSYIDITQNYHSHCIQNNVVEIHYKDGLEGIPGHDGFSPYVSKETGNWVSAMGDTGIPAGEGIISHEILFYDSKSEFPEEGIANIIYADNETHKLYAWKDEYILYNSELDCGTATESDIAIQVRHDTDENWKEVTLKSGEIGVSEKGIKVSKDEKKWSELPYIGETDFYENKEETENVKKGSLYHETENSEWYVFNTEWKQITKNKKLKDLKERVDKLETKIHEVTADIESVDDGTSLYFGKPTDKDLVIKLTKKAKGTRITVKNIADKTESDEKNLVLKIEGTDDVKIDGKTEVKIPARGYVTIVMTDTEWVIISASSDFIKEE